MKDNTLKRWLKLGFCLGWTPRDQRNHAAGFELGIQKGIQIANDREKQRKRESYRKNLAKRLANV